MDLGVCKPSGDNSSSELYEKLPKDVIPTHYDLCLKPDLEREEFQGNVSVLLKVTQTVHEIKFHSAALSLSDLDLLSEDGTSVTTEFECLEQQELVKISIASGLPAGIYKLFVRFEGSLDDNLRGFYKAKYRTPDGIERTCAITQFEASKAHRCFPCWDEPAFKATFDVTVHCAKDRVVLSNMPVASEDVDGEGNQVVRFCTSPIMSTYLVAVVVGEFDYIEQSTSNGVKLRVYTPLKKQEQGHFALEAAVKTLPYFEDFFKVPYPLPKLDLIAVPSLSFGAMENWGLITYRETCLLVDPKISSTRKMQSIALVVAHEIAHQWFGNLVTMEWWDHLWLNEGYATFMEFLSVERLFPEYQIWNQFISLVYSPAMKLDALKTSHSVEVAVKHPLHVDEIFDAISYDKGASLIRMIHAFIGDDNFKKGMNKYLNKFKYRNASTEDLWEVLEEASQKPIRRIMPAWTQKVGYPVVSVERVQQGDECKLLLKQVKFCASGDREEGTAWIIPVEYSTTKSLGKSAGRFEFSSKEDSLIIKELDENEWIKLNPSCFGFYRVHYSPEMLERLMPAISDHTLPPIDRLGLLNDLFALVRAGYSKSDKIFELLLSMSSEDSCMVWSAISAVVLRLKKLLEYADQSVQKNFSAFGRHVLRIIKEKITWDVKPEETHEEKLLRTLVLELLGEFDDEATTAEAEKRFRAHVNGSVPLQPDLRTVFYALGLKNADLKLYHSVLEIYHDETLQEEKERLLNGLAAMKDESLTSQLLEYAMSSCVRKETSLNVLSAIAQKRCGREQVWDYLMHNWDCVVESYAGTFALPHFISGVFTTAASSSLADHLEFFCANRKTLGMERCLSQAIENIRVNADWLERDLPLMKSFLKAYE